MLSHSTWTSWRLAFLPVTMSLADIAQVLRLVPSDWPMQAVSTFFQQSLRRQMHDKSTAQILKAIAAGQNLEVRRSFRLLTATHHADVRGMAGRDPHYSAPSH